MASPPRPATKEGAAYASIQPAGAPTTVLARSAEMLGKMLAPLTPRRPKLMRQHELVERVKAYDPDAGEALLNKAYVYAMTAHGKQFRASGDPYFTHPLEVAAILTELKLDVATIVTALLHDTVEDTDTTFEQIEEMVLYVVKRDGKREPFDRRKVLKGLELACHIPGDIPRRLVGDPGRLRQIIINLVSNAIKFTRQGEVVLHVETVARTAGAVEARLFEHG